MKDITETLKNAARRSGLSMKAMSDRSGIPYAAVHGFVTDDARGLTLKSAAKLARVLGLELRPVAKRKRTVKHAKGKSKN